MPKYSTGSGGGDDGGASCELCGSESSNLRRSNVAGAKLLVCSSCAPHGDTDHKDRKRDRETSQRDESEPSRDKRAAQNAARISDAAKGDSRHWEEEGTDYEDDRLPYLVSGYGERVKAARQEAGLQPEELAAEIDVDEDDLVAVEQGRAARARVGGSVVEALERRLEVELIEE